MSNTTLEGDRETGPIIDVDSHITEPADLWTSRMPKRLGNEVPHVIWDDVGKEYRWQVGDVLLHGVGALTMGGWREPYPFGPASLEEAAPATYEAKSRVHWLDENGITAQVLYPNLLGFDCHAFLTLGRDLALECVKVYNDFVLEWETSEPGRFIPIMSLPFWDLEAAEEELVRCRNAGHRGIVLAAHYEKIGFPNIADEAWTRVLAAAQDLELSINFHIGFSDRVATQIEKRWQERSRASLEQRPPVAHREDVLTSIAGTAVTFLSNAQAIGDVIVNGLCETFPLLKFVSVESGFGYVPFLLQALDWQWGNLGANRVDPKLKLLPSEYFRRQIFATLWYEVPNVDDLVTLQDNVMFETDFPHPTSLTPGPWSIARPPREMVEQNFRHVPHAIKRKVLWENARRLYHLDATPRRAGSSHPTG